MKNPFVLQGEIVRLEVLGGAKLLEIQLRVVDNLVVPVFGVVQGFFRPDLIAQLCTLAALGARFIAPEAGLGFRVKEVAEATGRGSRLKNQLIYFKFFF